MNIFERIQKLDRRWIYIVVALAIVIPLAIPFNSDNVTSPSTENLYQFIDSYAGRQDRAILLSFYHDASTMPELFPMEVAILRHCFERNVKVFMLTWFPQGAPIIDYAINTVKEEYPNIKSGVDYCNFGYIPAALAMPTILGMGDNIAAAVKTDAEGRKLENLEIIKGVNNYSEMNLVVEFSGSSAGVTWLYYARPKFGLNIGVGVTAVMAADEYPSCSPDRRSACWQGSKAPRNMKNWWTSLPLTANPAVPSPLPWMKTATRSCPAELSAAISSGKNPPSN
jgi:hypothetical protein